jgi:hypothetical protein
MITGDFSDQWLVALGAGVWYQVPICFKLAQYWVLSPFAKVFTISILSIV